MYWFVGGGLISVLAWTLAVRDVRSEHEQMIHQQLCTEDIHLIHFFFF